MPVVDLVDPWNDTRRPPLDVGIEILERRLEVAFVPEANAPEDTGDSGAIE